MIEAFFNTTFHLRGGSNITFFRLSNEFELSDISIEVFGVNRGSFKYELLESIEINTRRGKKILVNNRELYENKDGKRRKGNTGG